MHDGAGESEGASGADDAPLPGTPEEAPPVRRATRRGWLRGRRAGRVLALWAAAVALLAGGALLHRTADAIRGHPVRALAGGAAELAPPTLSNPAFPAVAQALAGTVLTPGHDVRVLLDTDLFDALVRDIAAARRSITFFVYYCEPGSLGDRLAAALAERARAGVRVLFLADGFACRRLVRDIRPRMEAAGARVAVLRPVRWYSMHRAQHRNHARMVVVDGEIGYTGGFGVADEWVSANDQGARPWRDTSVRFTGPAVRELQGAFVSAWAEATGELHGGAAFFPAEVVPEGGGAVAGLLDSTPGIGTTPAERTLALTLAAAERSLFVANSYFVPTPLLRGLLEDAARRGVDVRLLLPGPRTDIPSTRWAGRSYYDALLSAGVRVFEYQETMMHAKTIVADGRWAVIGSMNMDNRSARLNDEAALLVLDAPTGAALDSIFLADLGRSREITLETHRDRPVRERILEGATRLVAPVL